jgi:hypothetical protein
MAYIDYQSKLVGIKMILRHYEIGDGLFLHFFLTQSRKERKDKSGYTHSPKGLLTQQ